MSLGSSWIAMILGAVALSAGAPAWAAPLVFNGVTYTLYESALSTTEDQFSLVITGINGPTDTEGGRYGVNSFAFTEPSPGVVTGGSANGFAFMTGGLNAMGCDGSGNDFCFKAITAPTAPALSPNSELQLTFDVSVAAPGDFGNYDPNLKVQWLGTQKHYNLVSQTLTPQIVPLPATLPLLLSGIVGFGSFIRRRRAL